MHTRGRPTGYRPEYADLARNYCELGATNALLARYFHVAPRTIDNWIVNFSDFREAVQGARLVGDEKVWRSIYERATGYDYTVTRVVREGDKEKTEIKTLRCHADLRAGMIWFRNRKQWVVQATGVASDPPAVSLADDSGEDFGSEAGAAIPDPGFVAASGAFQAAPFQSNEQDQDGESRSTEETEAAATDEPTGSEAAGCTANPQAVTGDATPTVTSAAIGSTPGGATAGSGPVMTRASPAQSGSPFT